MSGPIVGRAAIQQPSTVDKYRLDDLMKLIALGCLAGLAGRPVAFAFRDFPADARSEIWARISGWFAPKEVAVVWSQADLRRLKSRLHKVRVVFIYQSRTGAQLAQNLAYMIDQRRSTGQASPAIISLYQHDLEDPPVATVVIRGEAGLSAAAGPWLLQATASPSPVVVVTCNPTTIPNWSPVLNAIWTAAPPAARLALAELRLLEGMLTGHWLTQPAELPRLVPESAQALASTYAEIRKCLQHPLLRKAGEPLDDLTHLMVHRANKYLRALSGQPVSNQVKMGARDGLKSTLEKSNRVEVENKPAAITFLELVNLGNPNSREFKTIAAPRVDSRQTGTISARVEPHSAHARSPPPSNGTPTDNVADTVTWSHKQVRTRFERLRQLKLIDVRRTAANGAIEYVLPEELRTDRSQFSQLPSFEDVQKHLGLR